MADSTVPVDRHVVVAMADPGVAEVLGESAVPTVLGRLAADGSRLPLAGARNLGARLAIEHGAQLLIFLDVDCIPDPVLVERYREAARVQPDSLLSGPVAYLGPPPPRGYDLGGLRGAPAHPARPVPAETAVVPGADHRLFWSLSFATTSATWERIGGFCEQYTGYGAEDTDFGQLARHNGVGHTWVGGAWAYHQHHSTQDPPVQHVDDILRNGALFRRRWGWWPMTGWLEQFEQRGLVRRDADGWSRLEPAGTRG